MAVLEVLVLQLQEVQEVYPLAVLEAVKQRAAAMAAQVKSG
jgi:hypothetical protein